MSWLINHILSVSSKVKEVKNWIKVKKISLWYQFINVGLELFHRLLNLLALISLRVLALLLMLHTCSSCWIGWSWKFSCYITLMNVISVGWYSPLICIYSCIVIIYYTLRRYVTYCIIVIIINEWLVWVLSLFLFP